MRAKACATRPKGAAPIYFTQKSSSVHAAGNLTAARHVVSSYSTLPKDGAHAPHAALDGDIDDFVSASLRQGV